MLNKLLRSGLIGILTAAILLVAVPSIRPIFIEHLLNGDFLNAPFSYNKAVRRAAPAVVNVYSSSMGSFSQEGRELTSLGAGVIMDKRGYILTNQHVVNNADQIIVALQNGDLYEGLLVGSDPLTDLAVLKIDADKLPTIPINSKRVSHIGDVVLAIGNPYNIGQTITQGIISATGRVGLSPTRYQNFLQTDASINEGNSGGALINTEGELVGINTMTFDSGNHNNGYRASAEGLSFAIPTELAVKIMNKLIRDGRVVRGFIGITAKELPRIRSSNSDIQQIQGLRIFRIAPNSPAEKAGMKTGDIILSINHEPATSAMGMMDYIAETSPGTVLPVTLLRDGNEHNIDVTISEYQPES
ncbi:outer membrane-stress sensor serine endopeptidase DegS [Proteus myxofaciens]|uniref:Serine endoprotease DegS n=1 Tax=Proteus myxofaciens ATCC 19692 TaxID=1354337 RepID=A0A198FMF1_9GAMM|nr:outer membrane-stress sensor serine endopeptidase DegS [Proteus myxofaciens]OAT26127.1 outer membrane stress sensor protease [Proteus myxofaciens ATCC 19692]